MSETNARVSSQHAPTNIILIGAFQTHFWYKIFKTSDFGDFIK